MHVGSPQKPGGRGDVSQNLHSKGERNTQENFSHFLCHIPGALLDELRGLRFRFQEAGRCVPGRHGLCSSLEKPVFILGGQARTPVRVFPQRDPFNRGGAGGCPFSLYRQRLLPPLPLPSPLFLPLLKCVFTVGSGEPPLGLASSC